MGQSPRQRLVGPGRGAPHGSCGDTANVPGLKKGLASSSAQLKVGLGCLNLQGTPYLCRSRARRGPVAQETGRNQRVICSSFSPFGDPRPEGGLFNTGFSSLGYFRSRHQGCWIQHLVGGMVCGAGNGDCAAVRSSSSLLIAWQSACSPSPVSPSQTTIKCLFPLSFGRAFIYQRFGISFLPDYRWKVRVKV